MLKKLFPTLVFVALFSLVTYAQKVKEPEHPDKEHEKAEKEGDKNNHMETWHGSGVPEIKETKESNPSEKRSLPKLRCRLFFQNLKFRLRFQKLGALFSTQFFPSTLLENWSSSTTLLAAQN